MEKDRVVVVEGQCDQIKGVTAQCSQGKCLWKETGIVRFDTMTLDVTAGGLIEECRTHHTINSKFLVGNKHNHFILHLDNKEIGRVSVASDATSGILQNIST